jgi:uncharacterized membrane protein YraQ (UPF0718 family)
MKNNGIKKTGVIIAVLAILLVIAVGYIIYTQIANHQLQKQISVFQQGAQVGFEQAIITIMQQASNCQQVPLTVEDQTLNLVAVECFQQSGNEEKK